MSGVSDCSKSQVEMSFTIPSMKDLYKEGHVVSPKAEPVSSTVALGKKTNVAIATQT